MGNKKLNNCLSKSLTTLRSAGQSDAQLFAAWAAVAEQCVGDFNMQNLANTAWAFATEGQLDV